MLVPVNWLVKSPFLGTNRFNIAGFISHDITPYPPYPLHPTISHKIRYTVNTYIYTYTLYIYIYIHHIYIWCMYIHIIYTYIIYIYIFLCIYIYYIMYIYIILCIVIIPIHYIYIQYVCYPYSNPEKDLFVIHQNFRRIFCIFWIAVHNISPQKRLVSSPLVWLLESPESCHPGPATLYS